MHSYHLEFILNTQGISIDALKNSMIEFGENLKIMSLPQASSGKSNDFMIHIRTQDPTIIFDTCAQFGRLIQVKVEEA